MYGEYREILNLWHGFCVQDSMKWQHEHSNLLITESGKLIYLAERIKEILGIQEVNGRLAFKLNA